MTAEAKDYRLDGIYLQRQEGFFMQRVKLPAGIISSSQARMVSRIAEESGRNTIHLTTRGSMEIHWLAENDLPKVKRLMALVGLTSRGACGGAVRGVTCSTQGVLGFPQIEALARRLHCHFSGNPRFERLPKKFKIGIEASEESRRHLIQDIGLVLRQDAGEHARYDIWVAGGLGREPQPGFLFRTDVAEERVIPLIESILRVYAANTPPPKRLKHLLRTIGEEAFRQMVDTDPASEEELPEYRGFPENLLPAEKASTSCNTAHFFAGMLSVPQLNFLADFADQFANGVLIVTSDQNILFKLGTGSDAESSRTRLEQAGFRTNEATEITFRICPGTHECKAGLTPTRVIAGKILETLTWAISGCHNSCTQPQLADYGIISSRLVKGEDGERTPRFDLYNLKDEGFGTIVEEALDLEELIAAVQRIE